MSKREREQDIAKQMSFCQHYDSDAFLGFGKYPTKGFCKAGVKYNDIQPKLPCVGGTPLPRFGGDDSACPSLLRVTREQAEAFVDKSDRQLANALAAIRAVAPWRNTKPPYGKQGNIECPVCKGTLRLSQSNYNGHVHAKCDTPECVAWME